MAHKIHFHIIKVPFYKVIEFSSCIFLPQRMCHIIRNRAIHPWKQSPLGIPKEDLIETVSGNSRNLRIRFFSKKSKRCIINSCPLIIFMQFLYSGSKNFFRNRIPASIQIDISDSLVFISFRRQFFSQKFSCFLVIIRIQSECQSCPTVETERNTFVPFKRPCFFCNKISIFL